MCCFVILHYKVSEVTIKCVDSILSLDNSCDCRIIIVDNNSQNSSCDELLSYYEKEERVLVVKNSENLGFANGNNIGYIYAKQYNPDFIIVMNNDMEIKQKDFIPKMQQEYDKYNFDILGPDVYSVKEKRHQNPTRLQNFTISELRRYRYRLKIIRRFMSLWLRLRSIKRKIIKKSIENETLEDYSIVKDCVLHGSCYIFSKKFIQENNECFYPKTFMYFEAEILHYLAIKNNYNVIYDPILFVYHYEDMATDAAYATLKKKYKFIIDCQIESSKVFLTLLKE